MKTAGYGFTVIELLAVIAIMSLFAAIAVPSYGMLKNNVTLQNETRELVDAIRIAQNRAITAQDGVAQQGIRFVDATSYVLFGGTWTGTPHSLGGSVQVISGAGTEVVFQKLTGKTNGATIVVGYPSGDQHTITIDTTGATTIL